MKIDLKPNELVVKAGDTHFLNGKDVKGKLIVTNQAMDYQILEQKVNFALMRHSYLKTYFAIKYKGSYIYGISNKKDKNDIATILDKFSGVIGR